MAEGEGFEPPVRFPVQWFSRYTLSLRAQSHQQFTVGLAAPEMGEHGLIRHYLFSALFSTHEHGRVVNSSSGFPSQAALSWTRIAKKPRPGAPIPSRTRDWDAYILINGPLNGPRLFRLVDATPIGKR